MKKSVLLLFLFLSFAGLTQIDGFSYQAVIINPEAQEVPGQDVTGNVLNRVDVQMRFSIYDAQGTVVYEETLATRTDAFGMVSVIIGRGIPEFSTITWDGTPKVLKVEALLGGSFTTIDTKRFTYTPVEFHRDISATGNMSVDGMVDFKGDLLVRGTTNLNSTLDVTENASSTFTGSLTVEEAALFNDDLSVANRRPTALTGTLTVFGESQLNNRLQVRDTTYFRNTLEVNGGTEIKNTLDVSGATTVIDRLRVIEVNPTLLTGNLTVDGETNLNSDVNIANESELSLSGDLNVADDTLLGGSLTVEGETNLNKAVTVDNGRTTLFKGTLEVEGQTELSDQLLVLGQTDLESILRVRNETPTYLSGTLDVGLATNLNAPLFVNNGSPTTFSGPLNVQGMIDFGNDLTVNGFTNLNGDFFVNNGAPVVMSGALQVNEATQLSDILTVDGNSIFNNDLNIVNGSATSLTGTLSVNGASTLNNSFIVANNSSSALNGTLEVDGVTTLNSALDVTNAGATSLSGLIDVVRTSVFNNNLIVGNNASTDLTGVLTVDQLATLNALTVAQNTPSLLTGDLTNSGESILNAAATINGNTLANGDLNVTGLADFQNLSMTALNVSDDNPNALATFSSTFEGPESNGIIIKLGKNHPRFVNGVFIGANQVSNDGTPSPAIIDQIKAKFQAPSVIGIGEMATLIPDLINLGAMPNINNILFEEINARFSNISFPGVDFPSIDFPRPAGFPGPPTPPGVVFPGITFFNGINGICSGQSCFSICFPFAGCTTICIPPVNVCVPSIPKIEFPRIELNGFNLQAAIPSLFPALPGLGTPALSPVNFPTLPDEIVFNHLDNDNEFAVFQDTDGRVLGSIRAESIQDFFGRTIDDDVYMVEVLSEFVGIDLAKVKGKVAVRMLKLVVEYNQSGLEYNSGNGDYAEWLERQNPTEYISAGDIVGVVGGKISKDLTNAEQIMAVSNRPIVLGNAPEPEKDYLGNNIAFIGQIPVKVIGPVQSGDYIVPHDGLLGYGKAVSPMNMTTMQFERAVGRSWENNSNEGPKLVNTVVGLQNGDWKREVQEVEKKQNQLDKKLQSLEKRLKEIEFNLNTTVN